MEITTATTAVLDAVCRYLRNEIDLEALEDSAAQYIHLPASLPANTTVVQLLGAIELSLAELSNGDITEPELRQDLRKELESSAAALPQATAAASGATPTPPSFRRRPESGGRDT